MTVIICRYCVLLIDRTGEPIFSERDSAYALVPDDFVWSMRKTRCILPGP